MAQGNSDSDASTLQFALLMDAIKNVEANVDSKLSNIKLELTEERESADDRLVKKRWLDGKTIFKKRRATRSNTTSMNRCETSS